MQRFALEGVIPRCKGLHPKGIPRCKALHSKPSTISLWAAEQQNSAVGNLHLCLAVPEAFHTARTRGFPCCPRPRLSILPALEAIRFLLACIHPAPPPVGAFVPYLLPLDAESMQDRLRDCTKDRTQYREKP